jgi:phospholipid/cholesterol/gamma-HCH transport system permease protein
MEARKLTVEAIEPATVRVHVAGRWHISDGLAPVSAIDSALARGKVERLVFDCEGLKAWDSSLVVFVERTFAWCKERQVTVERDGLPEGVKRLLALAELRDGQEPPPPPAKENLVARIGLRGMALGRATLDMLRFLGEAAIAFFRMLAGRARYRRGDLLAEIENAGARGLPIITIVSFLLGMILAFVGGVTLRPFGTQVYVADVVTVAMVRELGPTMTAIVMAGRTGSSYAAQLGTMQVTQEIDALKTLGIPPMEFLVLPRMLALSVMLPLLCVYADFIALLGGAVVAVGTDMSASQYLHQCQGAIRLTTFWIGFSKAAVFGVVVAICGCLQGLRAGKSAAAVGQAATSAVVTSIVWVIALDGMFAVLLHVLGI